MFLGEKSCVWGEKSCVLLDFLTKGATLQIERRVPGRNPFVSGLNAGVLLKFLTNSPKRSRDLTFFCQAQPLFIIIIFNYIQLVI